MPMNLVIQEKRKELGLTQEQVAESLNVSTPAVCKWEKGITSPDVALLPPLARLLKVDLNTLFCFQEDLTPQEISRFCKEIADIVRMEGFAAAFDAAAQKLREYPHSEELLHCLTIQMDGLLTLSGQSADEMRLFEDTIISWYQRLADKAKQMTEVFDMWEYNSFVAPLQVAVAEKDTETCLRTLRSMLEAMLVPWEMEGSPLFRRIARSASRTAPEKMLSAILTEMEGEPAYGFLQDCAEYQALIAEYREKVSRIQS